jgi:hypothetical protein
MHPLSPNYSELNDTDLHERLTKVLNRIRFAQSTGNTQMYQQLYNIYQDLLMEQQNRITRQQTTEGEDPFEGLININKK